MVPDKKSEVLFEKAKSVTVGDLHDELRYTERHMLFLYKSGREQFLAPAKKVFEKISKIH